MSILLVDDEERSRQAMLWILKKLNHVVTECADGEEALRVYSPHEYEMVLSDLKMPVLSGIELAIQIKKIPDSWKTDVVLFTGHGDMKSVVEALRAGVYDYLEKPVNVEELTVVIERVAEHQALLRENKVLTERFDEEVDAATEETKRELSTMKRLVAESIMGKVGIYSEKMKKIMQQASLLNGERSIPVLIEGETGTGKEIVAKMMPYGVQEDSVFEEAFGDRNCAALTSSLFESELFGYEAGAFTGSLGRGAKGKFDLANKGTLFLDEIGELPLELQGKLLRVLQEKEFFRVGGLKKIPTDVRIICATNVPLEKSVAEGKFRKDLYYRLKVAHILMPPLRERTEEIVPLANMFLQQYSKQKKKEFIRVAAQTESLLEAYSWPGNIRELQNLIEYATFAYNDQELLPSHVDGFIQLHESRPQKIEEGSVASKQTFLELPFPQNGYKLKDYTEDIILQVLSLFDQNQSKTAQYLGISRRALSYRLEEMKNRK